MEAERNEELEGRREVGDRVKISGQYYEVVSARPQYWSPDRIDDEDEFGKRPGWWTYCTLRAVEPTPEEAGRDEAASQAKAEKIAKAREQKEAYEAGRDEIKDRLAALIAEHSLVQVKQTSGLLKGSIPEQLAYLSSPGRGVSCDTELTIYRDPSGAVLAVSCGCPVDYGPTYYLLPALASQVEDKRRVWSWWNPKSYHADSYPGPGVPIEELTEGERGEVVTREQARVAMIRQERLGQIESAARMRLEDEGLIELKDKRFGKPKPCPIKAISYAVDPGPNVEAYLIDFARYKREREGDWPTLEGVDIVVQLPPEAWAKKGRKPAPVDALPRALKLSNYLNAIVRYEEVGANG